MSISLTVAYVHTLARLAGRAQVDPDLLDPAAAGRVAEMIQTAIREEVIPLLATPEEIAAYRASGDYRSEGDERIADYDRADRIAGLVGMDRSWLDRDVRDLVPGDRDLEDALMAGARRCGRAEDPDGAEDLRAELVRVLGDLYARVLEESLLIRESTVSTRRVEGEDWEEPVALAPEGGVDEALDYHLGRTLSSVHNRRDGQTSLWLGEPEEEIDGEDVVVCRPVVWWSHQGCWGPRAWQVTGTLVTRVSPEYGDTSLRLEDVVLTTVSPRRERATVSEQVNAPAIVVYRDAPGEDERSPQPLAQELGRALWQRLAREQARQLADYKPWLEDDEPEGITPAAFAVRDLDLAQRPVWPHEEADVVVTVGLPASGKTSYAQRWVDQRPDWRARLGRDLLRDELYGTRAGLTREQEAEITRVQAERIRSAVKAGKKVIIDDTCLGHGALEALREVVEHIHTGSRQATLRVDARFLLCPLEEAIRRQAGRPERERVPESVIRRMAAAIR
ncbi:MAG TPA: ATP-binding protein [Armatimonadota bacterium]|nr:ATP-binding protein [Armatimonadota bacterium]